MNCINIYVKRRRYSLYLNKFFAVDSIEANTSEAYYAQSKRDFIARLSISLKEAGETKYWIELLYKSNFINKTKFDDYYDKINELIRILTSIIKTSKNNLTN